MKFCPHASMMENSVPMSRPHLCGPGTMRHPSRNRKHTIAPIYTLPAVKDWPPQYMGTASQNAAASLEDTPCSLRALYTSESVPTLIAVAPPMAPGTRNDSDSSMP